MIDFFLLKFKARIRQKETIRARKKSQRELKSYIKSLENREIDIRKKEREIEELKKYVLESLEHAEGILSQCSEVHFVTHSAHKMMTRAFQSSVGGMDHKAILEKKSNQLKLHLAGK